MQVLFDGSDEAPGVKGLGYFQGQGAQTEYRFKIPHMGWNKLSLRDSSPSAANKQKLNMCTLCTAFIS